MSVSYFVYSAFGVKVPYGSLTEKSKFRGCDHPVSGTKFCPECGKNMWCEETNGLFDSFPDSGEIGYFYQYDYNEKSNVVLGYKLFCAYDRLGIYEQPILRPEQIESMKLGIAEALKKCNLDPKDFAPETYLIFGAS